MKRRFGPLVRAHNAAEKSCSSFSASSTADASTTPMTATNTSPVPATGEEELPEECATSFESEDDESLFTNSSEGDAFRASDLENTITFRFWYRIWTWLRLSETMCILKERIDKIALVYTSPPAQSYLEFLFSTAPQWAVCCFNWSFTLGYQSTAMQEGIHWSLKARLCKKKVELHKIVDFFRDVMSTRRLTRERLSHADTLSQLHVRAATSGCFEFSESIKIYLTLEGQQDTLRRLNEALNYLVSPLLTESSLRSALVEAESFRTSSARRFSLFIDSAYGSENESEEATYPAIVCNDVGVKFFRVQSRSAECTVDLVAVLGNGSFACTDPTFANMGLPCKHIMAVFLSGDTYLNPGLHYNPEYQKEFVRSMNPLYLVGLSKASSTRMGKPLTAVTIDASSDYAVVATEQAWSIVGLGGERFRSVLRPTTRSIRTAHVSVKELLRKEQQYLEPFLASRLDLRTEFYVFAASVRAKMAKESIEKAEAMCKAMEGSVNPRHVAATLIVDKCNKRKVAGNKTKK